MGRSGERDTRRVSLSAIECDFVARSRFSHVCLESARSIPSILRSLPAGAYDRLPINQKALDYLIVRILNSHSVLRPSPGISSAAALSSSWYERFGILVIRNTRAGCEEVQKLP